MFALVRNAENTTKSATIKPQTAEFAEFIDVKEAHSFMLISGNTFFGRLLSSV
jgi:hypothetical protein